MLKIYLFQPTMTFQIWGTWFEQECLKLLYNFPAGKAVQDLAYNYSADFS